jgi:hypothetical protein
MVPSTVKDIERAIETLTAREIAELHAWLDERYPHPSMPGSLPTSPPGASTRRLIAPWKMKRAAVFGRSSPDAALRLDRFLEALLTLEQALGASKKRASCGEHTA